MTSTSNEKQEDLVYVSYTEGHREHYIDVISQCLPLKPICAPLNWAMALRLLRARNVLFATLDDHILLGSLIILLRGIFLRKSAALFLSPQRCFDNSKLKYKIRRIFFRGLRNIHGLKIFTVLPFYIDPRYTEVAHAGIADPQLWDLYATTDMGPTPAVRDSCVLTDEILNAAQGRIIVVMPGTLSDIKGFKFLTDIISNDATLHQKMMIVAAGKVPENQKETAQTFISAGGYLIDRYLSDDELLRLYDLADLIWACYSENYDQSSGIFGRAIQMGVPIIIRRTSLIDKLSTKFSTQVLRLAYGDTVEGARELNSYAHTKRSERIPNPDQAHILSCRNEFLQNVGRALDIKPHEKST